MPMEDHDLVAIARLDHNVQFFLQLSATDIDPKFSIALPHTETSVLGLLQHIRAGFPQC